MSGIAAVVSRDREPVDPAAVEPVVRALGHRAIDGERRIELGWAVVSHAHFRTTPEEAEESQPIAHRSGRYHLAFDGRLDNRGEITSALGLSGPEAVAMSDAALALEALERFQTGALERFVGPFALIFVDAVQRRVLLARDTLGDRGLVYALTERVFVAASEESAVLRYPGIPSELDDSRLAVHFGVCEPVDDATFFRAVKQVLPGHVVTVEDGRVGTARFRAARPDRSVRSLRPPEHVHRFRELLAEAVSCRLRTVGRGGVLLSGGLDSGPIAALAAESSMARGLPVPVAISWVFSAFPECDEREFIAPIAAQHGLESETVPCDDALPLSKLAGWPFNPNGPLETPYRWLSMRGYLRGRERGLRTLLSGVYGDDLYLGPRDWLWSLLRSGKFLAALRGARGFSRAHGLRSLVRGSLIAPVLPRGMMRRLRPRGRPAWLTPHALSAWPTEGGWPPGADHAPREGQLRAAAGLGNAEGMASEAHQTHRCGVDLRFPFRDLRLVEFMLAVPSHLLFAGTQTRPILREALRGSLPPAVLAREDKADFSPLYRAALASPVEAGAFHAALNDGVALWRRFVRPEWAAEAAPGARATGVEELVLWHCIWLELWRQRLLF
ncbi:MAG: hypothetical protein LAO05_09130 [Acidobacteriia bacterium]|nr:hypothetical protein [Terriglobia bacterium]